MTSVSTAERDYKLGTLRFNDFLTHRKLTSWGEAINLFGAAAASGQLALSDAVDANYKVGLLWLFNSDNEKALQYFTRCLSIDPGAHFVHLAIGATYLSLGEHKKSAWHYRRLMALEKDAESTDMHIAGVGVGRALLADGNPEEAIEWFTKAPSWGQRPDALLWKGNAHRKAGEPNRAIESYEAALALNGTDADVHQALAETHLEDKADPAAALIWFDRMYAIPESTMATSLCRTRTPFAAYFCERFPAEETRATAFEALCALRRAVMDVKADLCCEEQGAAVHYTALDTSQSLVAHRSPLRAHQADMMNDPHEGGVLRSIVGEDLLEGLLEFDRGESASAFVASFVRRPSAPPQGTPADDNLLHWRLYGKSGGAEGSGACLIYPCTLFSRKAESHETASLYHSHGLFAGPAVIRNVRRWQQRTPRLYRVVYEGAGAEEAAAGIRPHLRRLGALRRTLATEEEKTSLTSCTRALLEEIRFLFKSRNFEYEKEARVVVMVWPHDRGIETNPSTGIKYVELAGEVYPTEVVLGPCVEGNPFAVANGQESEVEVRRSQVSYRQT